MALGFDESVASGLKVYDMESFAHPGGFSIIDQGFEDNCNSIHCSWSTDSPVHPSRARDADALHTKLVENNAQQIGRMGSMTCDGAAIEVGNLYMNVISACLESK